MRPQKEIRKTHVSLLAVVFLLALSMGACYSPPKSPPLVSLNGKLLYHIEKNYDEDLFVINADGTQAVNLTRSTEMQRQDLTRRLESEPDGQCVDTRSLAEQLTCLLEVDNISFYDPTWSPDGNWISFVSDRDWHKDRTYQAYRMAADGSNLLRLSSDGFSDSNVAWSPDGKYLVSQCDHEERRDLCVFNPDGSGRRILANYNSIPFWSPDSQRIAFGELNTDAILVINADGTGLHRITDKRGDSLHLAWSPDNTRIAFRAGNHDSPQQAIFIAYADGSGEMQLTDYETTNDWPVWSPNGLEIAFESERDGKSEIYKMKADGSEQVRLTYTSESSFQPYWSPDATRIAFESRVNDVVQIFIMNADGSGVSRLTWDDGHKCCLSWKP